MKNQNMANVAIVISIIAIALSLSSIYCSLQDNDKNVKELPLKFTLYFGISDDTGEKINEIEDWAVDTIISDYGYGYTCYRANGGYIVNGEKVIGQDTLVLILSFSEEDKIMEFVNRGIEKFGCAILVEKSTIDGELITKS